MQKSMLSKDTPRGSWIHAPERHLIQNWLQKSPHSPLTPGCLDGRLWLGSSTCGTSPGSRPWKQQWAGRWNRNKGRRSEGKSRLVCTPSPLLLTVGPEDLNLDPSWAISAECEAGAGGWHCGHPLPPGVPETSEPGELSVHELCSIAGP